MGKVAKIRLTQASAQERIRNIAKVSSNVILGTHAKERMADREIVRHDVDRVLRSGYIEGDPEQAEEGEWKCKMTLQISSTLLHMN